MLENDRNKQADNNHQDWLDNVKKTFEQHKGRGGFQILFPEYRPDMSRALAHFRGLEFFDYREKIMQPLGWDAGGLTLDNLTETLRFKSDSRGVVVHNIEALLATKTEQQRKQWLADFLTKDWKKPVLLPISIYQDEVQQGHSRICKIEAFPKQSFLLRMAM